MKLEKGKNYLVLDQTSERKDINIEDLFGGKKEGKKEKKK